jgi:hypothetical protein
MKTRTIKAVDLFVNFLAEEKMAQRILTDMHSYYLKHRAEDLSNYLKDKYGWEYEYCGNDEFIKTAINAGFNAKRCTYDRNTPNFNFNIKSFTMDEVYSWVDAKLCQAI